MATLIGRVKKRGIPRYSFRWRGFLDVETDIGEIRLLLPGSVAQWIEPGEDVRVEVSEEKWLYVHGEYALWRRYGERWVPVAPLFSVERTLEKRDPVTDRVLYTYRLRIREAWRREDFERIVELEQYHYASRKEYVAIWWCDGEYVEANVKPCEKAILVEIKGSLPVSRFIVMELLEREPYEPEIVGYLRIDPPVPLMHRRIGNRVEKNIRERVFPEDWFHPTYWPERLMRELIKRYGEGLLARKRAFDIVRMKAVHFCNTAVSRISRVVIHPDYRGDGLGMEIVRAALTWVDERDVPEMRKEKQMVEVIAQMARYHPFFERVGFKYLWDTASGRPVLYYPLTPVARRYIEAFLREDPVAREHGGRLYRPHLRFPEPIERPITLKNVQKMYESVLDVEGLPEDVKNVLLAFGVDRRVVQKYVLRGVDIRINPGEVVALVGASGAGKTTLLRIIAGMDRPDDGRVVIPGNARISALIPGESEPDFGETPLLEYVYRKVGDIVAAIELLNVSGLSDAVFYRARFRELSTGQKERARLAATLAELPNVLVVDEFAAHLDPKTAQRVARKVAKLCREHGITLVVAVHRREVLEALNPDRILYVGYGGVREAPNR